MGVFSTAITPIDGHLMPTRSERTTLGHSARYGRYVWPKDEQRIEEERAGIARPAPATLASSHLAQALDAFDDACSPEAVLTPRKIWPLRQSDSAQARRTLSEITQRNFCASATLFTAFAAEAFVNNFIQARGAGDPSRRNRRWQVNVPQHGRPFPNRRRDGANRRDR